MFIQFDRLPTAVSITPPLSPLNGTWHGVVADPTQLPQAGHLLLLLPLGQTAVSLANITVPPDHYLLWLTSELVGEPLWLEGVEDRTAALLVWLSPGFVSDMADFLSLPPLLTPLLNGVPLRRGDPLSEVLAMLAEVTAEKRPLAEQEEWLFEIVGQVLRLLSLRHQALLSLTRRKPATRADLLPRLLEARQRIESGYLDALTTADVAAAVGLSEFHFGRLFRAAFDVTVHQFVMRLRLDAARRALVVGDDAGNTAVTAVALHVGYSSLSSFIHAFRRRFGVTPTQYQARHVSQK